MEWRNQSAEAMVKPVEKAQRQEPVDPEEEFKTHLALTPIGLVELRAKALELALKEISFPLHDDKGNMFYERCDRLANLANRFYTYITKGE